MKAWLMEGGGGVGGPEDEVPTLKGPIFLICLDDGDEVTAKMFCGGGGGNGLKETVSKCGRCKFEDIAYCIQGRDIEQVLDHGHKLPKIFWDRRLGGEGDVVNMRWGEYGGEHHLLLG